MTDPPAKVLVLGIDAANPVLIRRWAAEGTLPHLAALMARGVVGETLGVEGFLVGSTWPTMYTGTTPARHGYHYLVQLKPGTYEYDHPRVRRAPFWTSLSQAGKRVAVIDVPLSELDASINGIHIVDWSGIEALDSFSASPPEVRDEVVARWGYPLTHACDGFRRTESDFRSFIDALVHGVEMRAELTTHYLALGGWDLFMQVFTESHCAGHQVWHLHDPSHPAHDPAIARAIGDPLHRLYVAIDAAIGRVVAAAGDTRVVVLAAHGMSFWYGAQFLLPEILVRLGVSAPSPVPMETGATAGGAVRRVWRTLPQSLREAIAPRKARLRPRSNSAPVLPAALGVDPTRSKCFVVRNGHITGAIRLNLAGREPNGVLRPAEADAFCETLTRHLLEIVDDRTGRPAIRRVARTADLFQGELLGELPDLIIDWDDAVPTGSTHHAGGVAASVGVRSPRIGVVRGYNDYTRTGDHRIGGLFIAAGGGLEPSIMPRVVSTMDFAPTFAAMLGTALPPSDGMVIREIVGPG